MSARKTDAPPAPAIPPALLAGLSGVDPCALDRLASGGPDSFNPFIGGDEAETFDNLEAAMQFLHAVISGDVDPYDAQRGMALYIETLWAAVHYEAFRRKQEGRQPRAPAIV